MSEKPAGVARAFLRALPRWRAGRYSLSRLFFNFYLLAMGSFVVIAFVADFIITTAQRGITDDYARRFMRGTITLIEDDLHRYPQARWPERIKVLDEKFAYQLSLTRRADLFLPPRQAEKLDAGDIAIAGQGEVMYRNLRHSDWILVVGPLAQNRNPELNNRGIPLELRLQLLTWSLIGVIFAIALWFWIRPVWRDLETLRKTARALGDGDFSARSRAPGTQLFAPLAETMNGMAERIQELIATHRELSCGISHELRTPIARMRFALEMLSATDDRDERERLWSMMEQDLDELDALIDASLTYARFERETPALHPEGTPLLDWLQDEVDGIRILGRKLDLRIDKAGLPENFSAELDRRLLPYALKNLLRNAIKYAREKIVVSIEICQQQVCLHVDDDGIGIAPEDRERVFSAFTRLDRSRDRNTGGYGLGLAIVRRVMEAHRGQATASESPLGGARFSLCWPIKSETDAA